MALNSLFYVLSNYFLSGVTQWLEHCSQQSKAAINCHVELCSKTGSDVFLTEF